MSISSPESLQLQPRVARPCALLLFPPQEPLGWPHPYYTSHRGHPFPCATSPAGGTAVSHSLRAWLAGCSRAPLSFSPPLWHQVESKTPTPLHSLPPGCPRCPLFQHPSSRLQCPPRRLTPQSCRTRILKSGVPRSPVLGLQLLRPASCVLLPPRLRRPSANPPASITRSIPTLGHSAPVPPLQASG